MLKQKLKIIKPNKHRAAAVTVAESEADMTDILNKQIDLLFQYWDGEITEEEFENNKLFSISEEVDAEMQQDRFY